MKVNITYSEMYPVLYITENIFDEKQVLDIPDDLVHNYQEVEKQFKLTKKNIEIYAKNKGYKIEG